MRTAIIDIGTNTFNLLIAEWDNLNNLKILYEEKFSVLLGKSGMKNKIIMPDAFQRGLATIGKCKSIASDYHTKKISGFATSAVRNAENGKDFVNEVFKQFQIPVRIIDGDEEAELIYKGIRLSGCLTSETSLLLDIGGGSIEFILCNQQEIFWKQSLEIGVTRLLEHFQPSNPITEPEIKKIICYFKENLETLFKSKYLDDTHVLIGASGAFTTFQNILAEENRIKKNQNAFTKISLGNFKYLLNQLVPSTLEERLKMPGLPSFRADYIVLAAIFVNFVVEELKIHEIICTDYALKEGALLEMITSNTK